MLAVLPLSFDYGLSQLTTAFHAGASVVLINYLLPRDIVKAVDAERITGLTAVPPLWIQLAPADWPARLHAALPHQFRRRMPRANAGRAAPGAARAPSCS